MKAENLYIGLSSFNNIRWKEVFYPADIPRNKWFEYYTQHFNTYELNVTFYKMPTLKSLQSWYKKVPENFKFSAKAPKTITHFKKFVDAQNDIDQFYEICREGLQEKLSYILFQLPPSFDFSPEKLQTIINSLNSDFKNAIEFRNKTWWNQEVFETLAQHNIVFCSVSYPNLPDDILSESGNIYLRLHGKQKLFYSGYTDEEVENYKENLLKIVNCEHAYIYFNNTASENGIQNALKLKQLLTN